MNLVKIESLLNIGKWMEKFFKCAEVSAAGSTLFVVKNERLLKEIKMVVS